MLWPAPVAPVGRTWGLPTPATVHFQVSLHAGLAGTTEDKNGERFPFEGAWKP